LSHHHHHHQHPSLGSLNIFHESGKNVILLVGSFGGGCSVIFFPFNSH